LIGLKFISKTLSRSDNLALLWYLLVIAELGITTILEGAELATSPPICQQITHTQIPVSLNLTPVSVELTFHKL